MGDDLDDIGRAWRASDVGHGALLARARKARRRGRWLFAGTIVCLGLLLAFSAGCLFTAVYPANVFLGVIVLACLWMMLVIRRQQAQMDSASVATPRDSVQLLIEHYRLRLYWWSGRAPLAVTAFIVVAVEAVLIHAWLSAVRGDAAPFFAWLAIAFAAWLVAVGVIALFRVRVLRRRVAELTRIEAQLSEDGGQEIVMPTPADRSPDLPHAFVGACIGAGLLVAGMTAVALLVPAYRDKLMEAGAPLELPTRILIMAGFAWRRIGILATTAIVLVLGAWLIRARGGRAIPGA